MTMTINFLDASLHLYKRVCPSVCWLVGPFIRWLVNQSVCQSVRLSISPSIHPSVHWSIRLSIGPSVPNPFFSFPKLLFSDLHDGYKVEQKHMHAHMHAHTHADTHTLTHTHKRAAHSGLKLHKIDTFKS